MAVTLAGPRQDLAGANISMHNCVVVNSEGRKRSNRARAGR